MENDIIQISPSSNETELFGSILLIEDNPAHSKLISRAIGEQAAEIRLVSSGSEGIRIVENSFVELVICDLHLPDMTALDVLRAVREVRPGLPFLVLTSSSDLDDAIRAMREGAWDYMVKQFSHDFSDGLRLLLKRTAERKEQQIRELQLRSERRNFWAAAHAAHDGLAILGSHGSVVFANKAFHNFARLVNRELHFDSPINIISLLAKADPSVAERLEPQLALAHSELLWNAEIQLAAPKEQSKLGAYFYDLSLTSVKLEDLEEMKLGAKDLSDCNRYILWARDITRRKEQERFQRDLLATTSHDLKGPLGAILTSAELLEDKNFLQSEKGKELITRIASCARNSINIIDELLSARKIQDGVLIVKPAWYQAEEILEETVLDYLPLAKAKSIDFSHRPLSPEMKVYADRLGLHRILGNLVSNAIKFTKAGGKVTLEAKENGQEIEISVSDTGAGIDPQERHKLFERYSRLEKHQTTEGTGLGLFVTKNLVDAHGGRIEINSEVGKGTTFSVFLPKPQASIPK